MSKNEILNLAAKDIVLPILLRLEKQTKQPISANISIYFEGDLLRGEVYTNAERRTAEVTGEVRMLVKSSGSGNGYRFSAESILNGLSPGSGFSGFSIRGSLKYRDGEAHTKVTSITYKYNVHKWHKDFSFE